MINTMSYSEKVIELIQTGNLDEVDETIQLALMHDDDDTIYLLGNSLYQLGFLEETRLVYNHLIDLNPLDDDLKIYLAEIEIEEGNDIDALEILHSINESSPAYPQALLVEADYYMLNDLPEVSLQKLDEANELVPNEPIILFALAEVYYTISDFQQAIYYYKDLLETGHEEIAGTLMSGRLGDAYLMIGDYKQSIVYLKEAIEYKDDAESYFQLGFAYMGQEDYEQAIDALNRAKVLDSTLIGIYVLLSNAYEQIQELEKALDILKEAIIVNEMDTDLYIAAGEIATKNQDYQEAKSYYQKALELEPDNDRVVLKYANYLSFVDEYEELIELFERSAGNIQEDPDASWLLATAHNMIDEYDKAREFFTLAYPYFSKDLTFLKEYAIFLREDGQRDKMKEILEDYLKLNPQADNEILSLLDDFNY